MRDAFSAGWLGALRLEYQDRYARFELGTPGERSCSTHKQISSREGTFITTVRDRVHKDNQKCNHHEKLHRIESVYYYNSY